MTDRAPAAHDTVTIRLLTEADAGAFWRVRLEALEREPLAFATAAEEHRATTPGDLTARLGTADGDRIERFVVGAFVGAVPDALLRGVAGFAREPRRKTRHKGTITSVYVGPELRSRGVGRQLLTALLDRARARPGLERVTLGVSHAQPAARRLYAALGFVPFGTEPGALKVDGCDVDEDYLGLLL